MEVTISFTERFRLELKKSSGAKGVFRVQDDAKMDIKSEDIDQSRLLLTSPRLRIVSLRGVERNALMIFGMMN